MGASLPGLCGASPPAEPSPILMTGERARGQEIGAGSCGSGDSAASRRAGGGRPAAGSGPKGRGCSFDPKTALLGSRCREPRRRGGRGAQALGTAGCSAAPPLNRKKKGGGGEKAEPTTASRLGLGGGPGGQENKAPDAVLAAPPQETHGQARAPGARPARRPCPGPPRWLAGRPRDAESESLIKTTPWHTGAALHGLLVFCCLRSSSRCGQCSWIPLPSKPGFEARLPLAWDRGQVPGCGQASAFSSVKWGWWQYQPLGIILEHFCSVPSRKQVLN